MYKTVSYMWIISKQPYEFGTIIVPVLQLKRCVIKTLSNLSKVLRLETKVLLNQACLSPELVHGLVTHGTWGFFKGKKILSIES